MFTARCNSVALRAQAVTLKSPDFPIIRSAFLTMRILTSGVVFDHIENEFQFRFQYRQAAGFLFTSAWRLPYAM
jgi:hypothetical protein